MIVLLALSIFLFFNKNRLISVLIFFFFLTNGFQLVPEEWFGFGSIIAKSIDYAILYVIFFFVFFILSENTIYYDIGFVKWIYLFLSFLIILFFINRYIYDVPWNEIFRTGRFYFLLLGFVVFLHLKKHEVNDLIISLFKITLFLSILFILQVALNKQILNGFYGGTMISIGELSIPRCYNYPFLLSFFLFFSFFSNPFSGIYKLASQFITVITLILPMHRSLIGTSLMIVVLGILMKNRISIKSISLIIWFAIALSPLTYFLHDRFSENTSQDLQSIYNGEFIQQESDFGESTMLFRFAHFYERLAYISNEPLYTIFGLGLMTEDSDITYNTLDFHIGLSEENSSDVIQLETADFSWSILILRFGFLGTLIYLLMYFALMRISLMYSTENQIGFLALLSTFLISFASWSLVNMVFIMVPLLDLCLRYGENQQRTLNL